MGVITSELSLIFSHPKSFGLVTLTSNGLQRSIFLPTSLSPFVETADRFEKGIIGNIWASYKFQGSCWSVHIYMKRFKYVRSHSHSFVTINRALLCWNVAQHFWGSVVKKYSTTVVAMCNYVFMGLKFNQPHSDIVLIGN
jgi:hypothetical protein